MSSNPGSKIKIFKHKFFKNSNQLSSDNYYRSVTTQSAPPHQSSDNYSNFSTQSAPLHQSSSDSYSNFSIQPAPQHRSFSNNDSNFSTQSVPPHQSSSNNYGNDSTQLAPPHQSSSNNYGNVSVQSGPPTLSSHNNESEPPTNNPSPPTSLLSPLPPYSHMSPYSPTYLHNLYHQITEYQIEDEFIQINPAEENVQLPSLLIQEVIPYTSYEGMAQNTRPFPYRLSPAHSVGISPSRPLGKFGQCEECTSPRTGYNWCQYCNNEHFQKNFVNWSSGIKELDSFIQEAQLKAINVRSVLEWIEYREFTIVKHLADGGNSSVFTASWPQGPIQAWDTTANNWERRKQIYSDNSDNSDLSAYHQFSTLVSHIVRCYGISRCPYTCELIVVTSYARDGDLRKYLSKNFDTFTWKQRIITLKDIARGLVTIHRAGLLHKDLHTGNILRDGSWTTISDLGLCWNKSSDTESDEVVRGVLPYVAPEVLRGHPYTRAADVYSIGMIMYELWSGKQPFEGREYDALLAIDICSGTRPEINSDIPDYYSIIMQACWNGDPDMRPTSRDLEKTFNSWIDSIANRQLVCPKMVSIKETNSETKNDDSSSSETIPSQPLPSLSAVQRKIFEEQDERREAHYKNYLDQRLLELAEQEITNKEPTNPMTWTRELKTLADKIFGDFKIKSLKIESTPIGNNSEQDGNKPAGIRIDSKKKPLRMQFLTKLLILLHIGAFRL